MRPPQPAGHGPLSESWMNRAHRFDSPQRASLHALTGPIRIRLATEGNTALKSPAIKKPGRSLARVASARTDHGQRCSGAARSGVRTQYIPGPSPSRLITEPEPEPHGSIASCHCAGPRDGPCDREWFLIRQRADASGKAGLTRPGLPLAPGHTAASPDQAMTAGNHISRPSRWVHPSGSVTDVAGWRRQCVRYHAVLCNRLPR
jgi:hypothetical protein